jgi:two-component system response regulator MprA
MRLLVVEDENLIARFVARGLQAEGYTTSVAADGETACRRLRQEEWDLVILDLLLPTRDGFDVLRDLAATANQVPVLVLSAKRSVDVKVAALDAGATDFLAKPFALDELLARVRAMLRRRSLGAQAGDDEGPLTFADLTMNPVTREVDRGGRPITFTRTEWDLLELFMRRPKRVLERAFILEEVWGYDFPTTANSLEVYVGYVRRKTEAAGESRLLHTVRGVGYVLRETPP